MGKIAISVNNINLLNRWEINDSILVEAKYNDKSCKININTVIYVVNIDLYIGNEINKQKCVWFTVFTTTNGFNCLCENFIKTILVTESFNITYEIDNTLLKITFVLNQNKQSTVCETICLPNESRLSYMMIVLLTIRARNLLKVFGLSKIPRISYAFINLLKRSVLHIFYHASNLLTKLISEYQNSGFSNAVITKWWLKILILVHCIFLAYGICTLFRVHGFCSRFLDAHISEFSAWF